MNKKSTKSFWRFQCGWLSSIHVFLEALKKRPHLLQSFIDDIAWATSGPVGSETKYPSSPVRYNHGWYICRYILKFQFYLFVIVNKSIDHNDAFFQIKYIWSYWSDFMYIYFHLCCRGHCKLCQWCEFQCRWYPTLTVGCDHLCWWYPTPTVRCDHVCWWYPTPTVR
jgi:hypothetical protein